MSELIKNLELLKAEIEWEHSIEYQIVIDKVIKKLKGIEEVEKRARNKTIDDFVQKVSEEMPRDICDGTEALYYIKEIADKLKEN